MMGRWAAGQRDVSAKRRLFFFGWILRSPNAGSFVVVPFLYRASGSPAQRSDFRTALLLPDQHAGALPDFMLTANHRTAIDSWRLCHSARCP
mmetsp:Transcript_105705/g.337722  ORF Transcript_105705/g.337722 Transcript_105705/m.337722 type:complete len:92 (-) Transcript_105705:52-327(-)